MSDQQIVGALADSGIRVARRTVAKYRRMMRIPSAAARRRLMNRAPSRAGTTPAAAPQGGALTRRQARPKLNLP